MESFSSIAFEMKRNEVQRLGENEEKSKQFMEQHGTYSMPPIHSTVVLSQKSNYFSNHGKKNLEYEETQGRVTQEDITEDQTYKPMVDDQEGDTLDKALAGKAKVDEEAIEEEGESISKKNNNDKRILQVVEKDLLIQEKERLYVELRRILSRQPGPEVAEQLPMYGIKFKEKTRQMKSMQPELQMYQAVESRNCKSEPNYRAGYWLDMETKKEPQQQSGSVVVQSLPCVEHLLLSENEIANTRARWHLRLLSGFALHLLQIFIEFFSVHIGLSEVRTTDADYARGYKTMFSDEFPFLVISQGSLDALNKQLKEPLSINRFRPNIFIESCEPFAEDLWRTLRINGFTFHGVKLCARCKV
eukprot:Gb_08141 [translate_table: standard]